MDSIKARQSITSVASTINAVLSILNGVTPMELPKLAQFSKVKNTYQFIIKLLESVAGYEKIVNYLSEMMVYGLPMLEDTVKITLTKSLSDIFSCSVNPTISEEIIRNGVVFDIKTVDLLNILSRCPLIDGTSKKINSGAFFYSDTEDYTVPDQLYQCSDLNAVIWYVKNRSNDRTVWYGFKTQGDAHRVLNMNSMASMEDGIITLEYTEKASDVKDCEGRTMRMQVPHNNCLHVFLGNAKGISRTNGGEIEPSTEGTEDIVRKTQCFRNTTDKLTELSEELETKLKNTRDIQEQAEIQNNLSMLETALSSIKNGVPLSSSLSGMLLDTNNGKHYLTVDDTRIDIDEYTYTHTKHDVGNETKAIHEAQVANANTLSYRTPSSNYYYHKTLFEFNTDYITSIKFFDPIVVVSQVINALTGCFDSVVNLSFEERLVQNEIKNIIKRIVESEDITVDDCFFTFSNDDYNLMVDETEKERLGKYTGDTYAYGTNINYEAILDELNQISSSATPSGQVNKINGAMFEISRTLNPEMYSENNEWGLNFEFLNNILMGLTNTIVYGIISPKIYMLIAINLKIMGKEPNFNISTFIKQFNSLIIEIVKSISSKIIQQMTEWLISLVNDLVSKLSSKLLLEQYEYYINLLTSCMESFRITFGGSEEWNMADVEYADIYNDNKAEVVTNTNC